MKLKLFILVVTISFFFNCKNDKKTEINEKTAEIEESVKVPTNVIDIVTRSMEFQSVDTILSGWNTFKYQNLSN